MEKINGIMLSFEIERVRENKRTKTLGIRSDVLKHITSPLKIF
jgi:hypothetical protein